LLFAAEKIKLDLYGDNCIDRLTKSREGLNFYRFGICCT